MPSSPGSVGLAQAHPLTKTQPREPSRQMRSSYGPRYPLGRCSSATRYLYLVRRKTRHHPPSGKERSNADFLDKESSANKRRAMHLWTAVSRRDLSKSHHFRCIPGCACVICLTCYTGYARTLDFVGPVNWKCRCLGRKLFVCALERAHRDSAPSLNETDRFCSC